MILIYLVSVNTKLIEIGGGFMSIVIQRQMRPSPWQSCSSGSVNHLISTWSTFSITNVFLNIEGGCRPKDVGWSAFMIVCHFPNRLHIVYFMCHGLFGQHTFGLLKCLVRAQ